MILVHTLTKVTGEDATTALDLLTAVDGPLVRVTADAAYDTVAVYEALLHESSLARTMPTDRILTGRCDMTLVGRTRSSD